MTLRFDVVDVFTDRPYAGNPLAVVHGATELTTGQLQAIAAEFGLSETAFPLPPTEPGADYRLRIFTPTRELPFAGHPSVGSAWVLAQAELIRSGDVVQECGAGLLAVHVDACGAQVTGGAPVVGPALDGDGLAAALGLAPADLDPDVTAGVAAAGVPFAFLPVRPDAVARAVPDPATLQSLLADLVGVERAVPDPAALRSTPADLVGVAVVSYDGGSARAHVRMFAPGVGVVEDPATGSAAVALAVFLVDRGVLAADGQTGFLVVQGAELGRPSQLGVLVQATAGAATRTSVYGGVSAVSRGELVALPG